MQLAMIPFNAEYKDQILTCSVQPDGRQVQLRLRLRYVEVVDKYFCTIWDTSTGECLLSNFPIVASYENVNDLLGQFGYMRIGTMSCLSRVDQNTTQDPSNGTLGEYEILWGDRLG